MFLFVLLVQAATFINQVAVEYKKTPLTRSAYNLFGITTLKAHGHVSFCTRDGDVMLSEIHSPSKVHNIHLFIEDRGILENSSFVKQNSRTKEFFIENLDAPVDRITLSSLYFRRILEKEYPSIKSSPVSLVVSGRDYYTPEQSMDLATVFSSISSDVKVIPESLAACIKYSCEMSDNTEEKHFYLNLRGSKPVCSLYSIKKEEGKTTIMYEEPKDLENFECIADYEIEAEVAKYVISNIKSDDTWRNVAFLPFENGTDKSHYADVQQNVSDFIKNMSDGFDTLNILQILIRKISDDSLDGSIIEKSLDIEKFKCNFNSMGCSKMPTSIPEGYKKYLISDIKRTDACFEGFFEVPYDRVLDGLLQAHSPAFVLSDPRVVVKGHATSVALDKIEGELSLRRTVLKDIVQNFSELRKTLTYVEEAEVEPILSLFKEDLANLHILKEIKKAYEGLQSLSIKRIANAVLKDSYLQELRNRISEAKDLEKNFPEDVPVSFRENLASYCAETENWINANESKDDALSEIQRRSSMLSAHIKLIRSTAKKIEEEKAMQKEQQTESNKDERLGGIPEKEKDVATEAEKEEEKRKTMETKQDTL
ncbi:uncharacterized protein VICG_01419 [Vittaforma corneae ATCC 50505]|uniref:Uncharacterized protein n=1 Tax=Vittaforma corneae (strain ATCC 50505) TaxID=993615 RepID=L2GM31_VITCO|nr:uncharacterized protein VICG_01419 [Vittaforma corneae ATCC 50505]ELA41555.1 hypothetical protein VICG_01419 [Vittaforma corneae ATCC 50505]